MHLFPESGFDQSAITPVFLGVLVSWFFTETLGWVFVGLVVPGYLATLLLLDPRSAAIDVGEACITYAVARLLCEHLSLTGLTSRLFGRERFLTVLLVSVLVRLAVEGALIPWALPHAQWAYSIGLVLVPLLANACWKTGLLRGTIQNGVPTLMVYGLLRWVLLPHTNLSLAGFHLSIEDVASGFLRSPLAYVLLLTGAVLAAISNVRYGWDFGGILIPALLALVVATPTKLAATFGEAFVLVVIVSLLLRFTALGRWNIEGPRRPVLFLCLDYVLRFAVAAVVGRQLPGTEIVELTGLGYLLPSLLAVKVSQRTVASVFLPTVTVSVMAFAVTSASAAVVTEVGVEPPAKDAPVRRRIGVAPGAPSLAALWVSQLCRAAPDRERGLGSEQLEARALSRWARSDRRTPEGFEEQPLDNGVVLLRERFADLDHRHGFPALLLANHAQGAPLTVVLVPSPLAAPQAAAFAGHWLEEGVVDAVVVAGIEEAPAHDHDSDLGWSVARALADAPARPGLVVSIRASRSGCAARLSMRASSGRAARALLARRSGDLPECQIASSPLHRGEDLALTIPASASDRWLEPLREAPSLTTSSALALAFSEARLATSDSSLEELLVLRRLVLEPLLENTPDAGISAALSGAAASMLGYQLFQAGALPDGASGKLLLPGPKGGALAVVAHAGGTRGLVLEAPHAGSATLRSLTLRLAKPLHADAVIVGLQAGEGALGNDAFAEAHAVATWPRRGRSASVVSVRTGAMVDDASIGLAEWGGSSAQPLTATVEGALGSLDLQHHVEELDVATREQAGRSLFGTASLVSITASAGWLRALSPSTDAELLREFEELPSQDAEVERALTSLATEVPKGAPDAPESVLDTASAAAAERSVNALRQIQDCDSAKACRASVVRADSGVYLVVVARRAQALWLGAFPLLYAVAAPKPEASVATTVAGCAAKIAAGGRCMVKDLP